MSKAFNESEKEPGNVADEAAILSELPTNDASANIVDWDGLGDSANPVNWPVRKRWAHIITVAMLGFIP